MGVTRSGNENFLSITLLENVLREHLDRDAPRYMCVLDPLRMNITGLETKTNDILLFPSDSSKGTRNITISDSVWVEKSDWRDHDDKNFYGMAPGKFVGLKYLGVVKILDLKDGVISAEFVDEN